MKKIPYEINQKGEKGTKKFCGHFKFLLKSTKNQLFKELHNCYMKVASMSCNLKL